MLHLRTLFSLALVLAMLGAATPAMAQGGPAVRRAYQSLLARERALTANGKTPSAAQVRRLVDQYVTFAGRYARSGYADNALWQAARLSGMLGDRLRREPDRATGRRLLKNLISGYPSSSLLPEARAALKDLSAPLPKRAATKPVQTDVGRRTPAPGEPVPTVVEPRPAPILAEALATSTPIAARALTIDTGSAKITPSAAVAAPALVRAAEAHPQAPLTTPTPAAEPDSPPVGSPAVTIPASEGALAGPSTAATLREIRRAVMPEVVRVTLELSREITYRDQRLDSPSRVFFDLAGTAPDGALSDAVLSYASDVVREIRVGRRPDDVTRVVLNLEDSERYSVFTLYSPYRLVIDVHRKADARKPTESSAPAPTLARDGDGDPTTFEVARPTVQAASARATLPSVDAEPMTTPAPPAAPAPSAPEANASGSFSIARQLGLNVSRIVIDPGHGGHDPGALGSKVSEAEVVLDVALRLEKLLRKNPAFDVVLTRRTNVFIPLEERTAIANRARADLFLSIHANASRNSRARGVETYFLNFASNPEAAAVAARENAASGRSMHQLGDIVRAIALNNKLDESRELASIIQANLARRLRDDDAAIRDLGVKQAPFVVLIGASMPSVLAEISFVSNPRDAQLLRSTNHRQKIAESLYEALVRYQRTLKASETVALQ